MSKSAFTAGAAQSSPLDPIEEESLRNKCWYEAADGKYRDEYMELEMSPMMKVLRASCAKHQAS